MPKLSFGRMRFFVSMCLTLFMAFSLGGCQTFYQVFPPSTDLHFRVDKSVNPDIQGNASPVVVKVYALASPTVFESKDFFTLYDNPDAVLNTDLLKKTEFEFVPGKRQDYKIQFTPAAQYLGVVVAYRNIENARWRAIVKVDPTGYDDLYVYVDKLATYIRKFDLEKKQQHKAG